MTGRRVLAGAVIVTALVLLAGRWSAALYTDYLWYLSLGARDVWRAKVATTAVLTAASFTIVALFAFVNFYAVRQSVVSLVLPRRLANIEIGEEVPGKYLFGAVLVMSAVVAGMLTFPADQWHEALLAHIGRPFGETDPYFGADLGFFVYWLPFETAVHYWAIVVLVAVTVLVILLYALTPSLRWERGTLHVSAYVRRHFTMLGAVLLLVLAWSYRLGMYRLLAYGGGAGGVFTIVDHRVIVPATLLLSVVTMCAAIVVAWAGWTGQMRLAFGAVTTVILLSLVSRTIAPLVVRRSLEPNAQQEAAYLGTRLTFTRRAFGVFRMKAESLGTGFTTAAEAASKVAVWDAATLSRAAERLRRVRVVSDGAAWQTTPSGMAALLVEHGTDGAPDSRDVWGIDRFDPAASDERGLPVRAPGSALSQYDLVVAEPAVYDSAPSYSVLSDSLQQLAGVEMVSTRSRLMHAWSLQNFRLLFGEIAADRPVMVRRRDVRARVEALAPFFVQGSEVVPVIAADSLYWVVELYSSATHYPLAQRFTILGEDRGYFQHAATALVHAASGRVRIIIGPSPDPVAVSWLNYLPQLLKPPTGMPPAVRAMLPPITDAARTQALAFAAAGMLGQTLEVRHFAVPDGADSSASREPARAVIPTLGGVAALWPLLDSTERVRGVIAASGGPVRVTSWIPMANDGARWGAVLDRMRATDTLLHESGTVRTPLRVVPVAGRPLYIQPTFQLRPGAAPTLVRVAAVQADSVRAGTTLATALGATSRGSTTAPNTVPDLRLRADSLYRVMREALARGDWTSFGRAFDALGLALRVTAP
ncbi:MAG: UPF0182 family protein [Gemmatimonadaceae bacterium]